MQVVSACTFWVAPVPPQAPGLQQGSSCGASDPDWASHTLGVFICLNCSGIHRNIPQVSKVKSVRLDSWDDVQVEFMAANGNNVAKARYESKIPPFYYKPTFPDCQQKLLNSSAIETPG
uniref:Arf-GAP domain-containing protein n=1 Tax=Chelonoidis abingdonii TaxID=106734 RepID=A0A8C0ILH6_CHEAB